MFSLFSASLSSWPIFRPRLHSLHPLPYFGRLIASSGQTQEFPRERCERSYVVVAVVCAPLLSLLSPPSYRPSDPSLLRIMYGMRQSSRQTVLLLLRLGYESKGECHSCIIVFVSRRADRGRSDYVCSYSTGPLSGHWKQNNV